MTTGSHLYVKKPDNSAAIIQIMGDVHATIKIYRQISPQKKQYIYLTFCEIQNHCSSVCLAADKHNTMHHSWVGMHLSFTTIKIIAAQKPLQTTIKKPPAVAVVLNKP